MFMKFFCPVILFIVGVKSVLLFVWRRMSSYTVYCFFRFFFFQGIKFFLLSLSPFTALYFSKLKILFQGLHWKISIFQRFCFKKFEFWYFTFLLASFGGRIAIWVISFSITIILHVYLFTCVYFEHDYYLHLDLYFLDLCFLYEVADIAFYQTREWACYIKTYCIL